MAVPSKLLLILCPLVLSAQTSPEIAQILERLDRLERENRALTDEVASLKAQLAASAQLATVPAASPDPGSSNTPEQRLEIVEHRVDEMAQTKVESSQKSAIRLTGMALFNAFINSKQSGGVDYPIVAAPPGAGHDGATVRQSIVGLEFQDPSAVAGGKVRGSVYMDFFSGTTNSTARLRTADIQIDWNTRTFAAGIEKPIFNPREPSSLAQVGVSPLTGAGNLWLWLPQARFEQEFRFNSTTGMRGALGVVQTRELGAYSGNITAEASRPGLEGRFNFFHRLDDDRRLETAIGFHTSTTHAAGGAIPSNLVSLDWFFNPLKRLEFTGVFYSGTNIAHLGSGTRQGFGVFYGERYGIDSMGGWGQVTVHAARRWDVHLFTGQIDDANRRLIAGSIGKNLMYGGNVYFRIAPNVLTGIEASQLRTMYIGQGLRINNHYDLALAYMF